MVRPPVMEKKHFFDAWFSTRDFRHVISETPKCLKSVNSQNVIGFLWKPPYFTLSTVDVVYLKFYTSHRIGKVLKKYLFSAQIIKEPYILIFSQHFYTWAAIQSTWPPPLKLSLYISGWIRSFRTSLNIFWKTMFFSLKKVMEKG